jgi:hypothetical protein
VWDFWTALAWVWLALSVTWIGWNLLNMSPLSNLWGREGRRGQQRITVSRPCLEILGLILLYSITSPLMAFALFFGIYHAGGHVLRVLDLYKKKSTNRNISMTAIAMIITLALTAVLVWNLWQHISHTAFTDSVLHTVIVALTAVSVPHVVLITWWAQRTVVVHK